MYDVKRAYKIYSPMKMNEIAKSQKNRNKRLLEEAKYQEKRNVSKNEGMKNT
uniref:Uncharacterized protein n=1 Tax=Romanomermis culicivorax TaxID=13658 RepID=A0A915JZ33_ROMCU